MFATSIVLKTPDDFGFWSTVWCTYWCALHPFHFNENEKTLTRIQKLTSGKIVRAITQQKRRGTVSVNVESHEKLSENDLEELKDVLATCLRLDEDISPLYNLLEDYPEYNWVQKIGAGRTLRSPTVFEDIVKTICSTNCGTRQTRGMVARLCTKLGEPYTAEFYTFPTPDKMASATASFMRKEIRAGYRAEYLAELAQKVASGTLNVEKWRTSKLDTLTLKKEIKRIKGIGDYAADNILKLLGKYDFLALDTWLRRQFAKIYNQGKPATDQQIEEWYAAFGEWKGLVMWLDMVKDFLIK
ncbi:MAG: DNA-3-methyladenine glycosylase family protein [Candidatus Bathyarchaeia archaeon]